jgi:acetyl-CoA carboxylase biotin carboxyl carrier protein
MKTKIDYKEIVKLIDLLEERNLSHFELEIEGFKIKISKSLSPTPSGKETSAPSTAAEQEENSPLSQEIIEEKKDNLHYITSPMVGTFYRAPDPTSVPFVDVGDEVKQNQTLCIIEAMKLMNEIESDVEGILEEIYVENGKPVEYGQKLFAIHLASQ